MRHALMLTLALMTFNAFADDPSSIGNANVTVTKAGWVGTVVLLDTPDDQGALLVKLVPATAGLQIESNSALVSKNLDPALIGISKTYEASVSVDPKSGSVILSAWRDIGTSNWYQDTKIALVKGKFVVAGVTYGYSYREQSGTCDINFLTGQAVVNGKPKKVAPQTLLFKDATEENTIATCDKLLGL